MVSCILCGLSHNARNMGITFHRFPKKTELRTAWIRFVNETKEISVPPQFAVLCSQHFQESDFSTSSFRKRLERNAIPSVYVHRHKYERIVHDQNVSKSPEIGSSRQSEGTALNIEPIDPHEESQHSPKRSQCWPPSTADTPRKVKLRQQIRNVASENLRKAQQIRKLQKQTWFQKKRIFKLTSVIKELQTKNLLNADHVSTFMDEFGENRDIINRLFNRTRGRSVAKQYSAEVRKFSLTLHFYSPKAYNYVRARFQCCLPHPKTLSRWYTVVDAEPGITKEALHMLETKCKSSEKKYVCSLVFDEMALREKIDFYGAKYYGFVDFGTAMESTTTAIANKVLVFMLVCINDTWKVPIAYFFLNTINSEQKSELVFARSSKCR